MSHLPTNGNPLDMAKISREEAHVRAREIKPTFEPIEREREMARLVNERKVTVEEAIATLVSEGAYEGIAFVLGLERTEDIEKV